MSNHLSKNSVRNSKITPNPLASLLQKRHDAGYEWREAIESLLLWSDGR